MPLILVQNEKTADSHYELWKDIEGIQYHFPNQYKNKFIEGDSFIYYRGTRRAVGSRRTPEYFGVGKIGKKRIDPDSIGNNRKSSLRWFCDIYDYIPFVKSVPFKIGDDYFENIPFNQWGVGVRNISDAEFERIINYAQLPIIRDNINELEKSFIDIALVKPKILESPSSLLVPSSPKTEALTVTSADSAPRYSKYSKLYGDRSEQIIFKILTDRFEHRLRWVSKDGEKPGWDIEFYNHNHQVAVEVKGTSGKRFKTLEITSNEWSAAEKKREHYNLYLVADCLSSEPLIHIINNPYKLYLEKKISIYPTNYRMGFNLKLINNQ